MTYWILLLTLEFAFVAVLILGALRLVKFVSKGGPFLKRVGWIFAAVVAWFILPVFDQTAQTLSISSILASMDLLYSPVTTSSRSL